MVKKADCTLGKIPVRMGVTRGNTISPNFLTLALEDVFRSLDWDRKCLNIHGDHLSHLRFVDSRELTTMLHELKEASEAVGFRMSLRKTRSMSSNDILITFGNHANDSQCIHVPGTQYQNRKRQLNG